MLIAWDSICDCPVFDLSLYSDVNKHRFIYILGIHSVLDKTRKNWVYCCKGQAGQFSYNDCYVKHFSRALFLLKKIYADQAWGPADLWLNRSRVKAHKF